MRLSCIPAYVSANALPVTIEPNRNYKPPLTPHALCLTVFLSPKSFVRTTDRVTGKKETFDVKIDVYFNGSLCGSHYVPKRYSGDAFAMTERIVRFTGHRLHGLIEKPWIIVPPGQDPDGGLRESRRGNVAYAGAQQRWKDISASLLAEADTIGRDASGNRPAIGEYLETLAELPMPTEVEDMQKAGGPKFGVLDAVVTWGTGSKDGPEFPYLAEPTPARIVGCTSTNPNQSPTTQNVPTTPRSTYAAPQSRSEAPASARPIDDHPTASSPLPIIASPIPSASSPPSARRPPFPSLPYETPVKRPRGHYYDIVTTKQTLCEEMDSIALASKFRSRAAAAAAAAGTTNNSNNPTAFQTTNPRTTRASFASTMAGASSSPLSSAPHTPVQLQTQPRVGKGKGPSSPTKDNTAPRSGELMSSPFEERTPTAANSSKGKERAPPLTPTQANGEALDREFKMPALSEDCRVTYAVDGVVRNVGAARSGAFRESGVVMGARFLVGG